MPRAGTDLVNIIYVKFDDIDAGNSLKDSLPRNELKECVPITAITKTFPYFRNDKTATVQWKQCLRKLGDATTVHNTQGSTVKHMRF